jgi:sporulation protein YlmC with PRC-barrel domain
MILLSNIVSKKVLNLFSGKIEGTVKNLCFTSNLSRVSTLKMFTEEDDEFLIDARKIYSIGDSAVVIKNSSAMTPTLNVCAVDENSPINLEMYSLAGDSLGQVCDAELSNGLALNFLISKTHRIKQSQILNVGKNIVVNTAEKKVRICDFKPHISLNVTPEIAEEKVYILPQIETTEDPATIQNETKENQKTFRINSLPSPQKIVGDSNFLIGRKMVKTVYGLNNEIIIKKEFLINEKTIDSARRHGKLMELTVYSRKKA